MAYTKQTWQDLPSKTTPINASRLGHIEQGIYDAASTADTAASNASSAISGLDDKVDKVTGKGLSTNDFTDALKTKLNNIEEGAEVNVQSDWNQSDNSADDYIKNKPTLGTSAYKNSTSVVTDSSDLVESGAVFDVVGWGNKNLFNPEYFKQMPTIYSVNGDTVTASSSDALTWANIAVYSLKKGTYKLLRTNTQGTSSFRLSDDGYVTTTTLDANVDEITFTLNSDGGIKIKGFTLSNWTFPASGKFMISVDGGSYEPYHASVDESKCDNSVIAPVENGSTASQAYAVGSHAIRNGAFITWKNAKAQGETINDASDYTSGDVGSWLNPFKEISITPASDVTLQSNTRLTSDGRICVLNLSTNAIDISANTNTTILTVPSEYRPSGIAPLCPLMDFTNGKLLLGFVQPSQGTFRVISNEALTGATLRGSLVWTL